MQVINAESIVEGIVIRGEALARTFGTGFFTLPGLLKVVDQFKKIIFGSAEFSDCVVRQAKQFNRIIVEPALYIFIRNAVDLYLSVYTLKLAGTVIVRKMGGRYFDGNQFGFAVVIIVQLRLQLPVGAVFQANSQNPVAKPVEKQYAEQQYGSNLLQGY